MCCAAHFTDDGFSVAPDGEAQNLTTTPSRHPPRRYNTVHLDPPESFPQPPSFFWLPIDDQRHAAGIQDRNQPPGTLITMLCGRQLTQTQVTDAE